MKTKKLYEVRAYKHSMAFSKPLGRKLRSSAAAGKLVKRLRKSGMDVFKSPLNIAV